jgi:hypothetical protein
MIVSERFSVFMDYFIKAFDREGQTKLTIKFRENTETPKLKNSLGNYNSKLQSRGTNHSIMTLSP